MFDLGHLSAGLNAGFHHMARVSEIAVDGFHHGDQAKEQAALHVLNLWAQEVAGIVGGNILAAIITGDPFHGSREAAQALEKQYPKPAMIQPGAKN